MTDAGTDRPDQRAAGRLRQVTADLAAETRSLQELLDGAGPGRWATPTPAAGWTVQDQVHHLAWFDEATVRAATDPDGFRHEAAALIAPGDDFPDRLVRGQRDRTPGQSAAWLARARAALLDLAASASPALRLPWYGPDMGITSAVTARLMETWAHGQDVADALGVTREPTDRLRHVAHLGVATRAFGFRLRGLDPPDDDVAVELTAPGGDVWRWGDPGATQRVSGTALDFCLVVTQRRHRADTTLVTTGDVAARWLAVAQAFAGVPGPGREPLTSHPSEESR